MTTGTDVRTTDALLDGMLDAIRRHDAVDAAMLLAGGRLCVDNVDLVVEDPRAMRDLFSDLFAALPDLAVRPVRAFGADDRLSVEVVVTGTLTGALRGRHATGRRAELFGRAIVDLADGRPTVSLSFDRETAIRQLGLPRDPSSSGRTDCTELLAALADDPWWRDGTRTPPAPTVIDLRRPEPDEAMPNVAPAPAAAPEPQHERTPSRRAGTAALLVIALLGATALAAGIALDVQGTTDPSTPAAVAPVADQPVVDPPVADQPVADQPVAVAPDTGTQAAPPVTATREPWVRQDLFAIGSTTLRPGAADQIAALADEIRLMGASGTVTVTGYTDDVGSAKRNLALSQTRADAVAAALSSELKDSGWEVTAVGAGETDPVVPNTTYANQAQNRRVEVTYVVG